MRLLPSAALPFGAFEAALAHECNADVSADFVRAAGFGAGAAELDPDALAAVRAAVLRLRAPPTLQRELLSALAAEGACCPLALPSSFLLWCALYTK